MTDSIMSKYLSATDIVALFIDYDNSHPGLTEYVIQNVESHCKQVTCFIYADWNKCELNEMERLFHFFGYETVYLPDGPKGKNAADMKITVDAMDMIYLSRYTTYGVVSSDFDFSPLARRVNKSGIKIIGFGEDKSKMILRNGFTDYFVLESEQCKMYKGSLRRKASRLLIDEDIDLNSKIKIAIIEMAKGRTWAYLSSVVHFIKQEFKSINLSDYFCNSWPELFDAACCCSLSTTENGSLIVGVVHSDL